jgi:hypothetical protein
MKSSEAEALHFCGHFPSGNGDRNNQPLCQIFLECHLLKKDLASQPVLPAPVSVFLPTILQQMAAVLSSSLFHIEDLPQPVKKFTLEFRKVNLFFLATN